MVDIPRQRRQRTRRHLSYVLIGAAALVGVSVALRRLQPASPVVGRSTIWMDTVRRGPLVREVLGQGTLVPEEIRWIAAKANAQVERVLARPGAVVRPDTLILELTNSDLQLQALEAERQVAQAEAELTHLEASLNSQELAQESVLATLASELADARRRASADEELAQKGFLSELEHGQTLGRASELSGRVDFEKKRLSALSRGIKAQVTAQRAQIERLRSIAEFRREEVDGLRLRAGVDGVLQELSLEQGQAVAAGALLAKVVRPDRLQAEIRIPENQAKDVQVGQRASVDTRAGVALGRVARIDPAAQGGSVRVDVALEGLLPAGARPDLHVEATIEIERLPSVLFVGRPASSQPGTRAGLFKLDGDGEAARRVNVELGSCSVANVEILSGLAEGDRVILSDMSQWGEVDRIRLQ
jgi:HlyD family secretion protein